MLDHFAIHVHHVQRSVRRVSKADRSKPNVGRSQKLGLFLESLADPARAARTQTFAVHEIAADVADKHLATILLGPGMSAINHDASRAGEISRWLSAPFDRSRHFACHAQLGTQHSPRLDGARAKNGCLRSIGGDAFARGRLHQRIAAKVALFHQHRLQMIAIGTNEFVPPIVERESVLPAAASCYDLQCPRIEGEIAAG